ncbi:hypothetical protein PQX77_014861 [Marasmius sp. AFHP31]|nr:hypothetical protein PQX77_014861 [Marasmius sp. AFHP31]
MAMLSSAVLLLALSLFGSTTPASAATTKRAVTPLPANGKFDYQIGGVYTPASDVRVVTRDREASPVSGKYNICYVNAFQTQPGEQSLWQSKYTFTISQYVSRPTAFPPLLAPQNDHLLLRRPDGSYFIDDDWPDEFILDTSTDANRQAIATIVNGWISDCASKGFNAIEADNLDTFTRTDGLLTKANNLAYAKLLADHAHSLNLAFGQKNAAELGSQGKQTVGFDFAVAEECQEFDECDEYTDAYGNQVLEIEYVSNGLQTWQDACNARGSSISIIYRDVEVVAAGQGGYEYREC